MDKIIQTIAGEFNIRPVQVENTIKLIDEGNTIPFIARYRKEVTGNLSDEILRDLNERLTYLRNLEKRKEEVIKTKEKNKGSNCKRKRVRTFSKKNFKPNRERRHK